LTSHLVQRAAEQLIWSACRRLPADVREERYREWTAELPAILDDPDVRFPIVRGVRTLRFAASTQRSAPWTRRRLRARAFRILVTVFLLYSCVTNWQMTAATAAALIALVVALRFNLSDDTVMSICMLTGTVVIIASGYPGWFLTVLNSWMIWYVLREPLKAIHDRRPVTPVLL
jgi:hypothetical protein